jgi:hypothetical protein
MNYVWVDEEDRNMLHFRSCPKCTTGTIEQNNDAHGDYLQCLNCGFMRDVAKDLTKRNIAAMLKEWRKDLQTPKADPAAVA